MRGLQRQPTTEAPVRCASAVAGLIALIEVFRPAFTRPSFEKCRQLWLGWLLTQGRRTVTGAIVASGQAGRRHHAAWHRFFSTARWSADELGRLVLQQILAHFVAEGELVVVSLDDTLAPKKGPRVWGIGNHIDAVRSSRGTKVFCFGHVWVVLCVVVQPSFSHRPWALPVLFRLYRSKKTAKADGVARLKKTELARELVQLVASWVGARRIRVLGDSAYCCAEVGQNLPCNSVLVGAMRHDAALTTLPDAAPATGRGRPRLRGPRLPTPAQMAQDEGIPWRPATVRIYGRDQIVEYKTVVAQWYRVCHALPLRVVIVRVTTGEIACRVYFSSDATMSPEEILQAYALRWPIEVTFRDLKQHLGFADPPNRKRAAVERTAPWVGLLFSITVLWYDRVGHGSAFDWAPLRPWYRQRRSPSFQEVLATARRAAAASAFVDPIVLVHFGNKSGGSPLAADRAPPPTASSSRCAA